MGGPLGATERDPVNSSVPIFQQISAIPQSIGALLPLLSRDLTEQASRPRTYIVRMAYAVVLFGFALWVVFNELGGWSTQSFDVLGRGRPVFLGLGWFQFCAIYLFLPAMTCGIVTAEKERDTLSVLLLTRLGPWSILLGKLGSRLLTMGSFLCLSLPLVAVAYGLGGIETTEIASLAWTLAVTTLQVGALAVACSAWCRTTSAAFLATYLIGALLIAGPSFVSQGGYHDPLGVIEFLVQYSRVVGLGDDIGPEDVTWMLFGPRACLDPASQHRPFGITVLRTVPMLLFAGTCLLFARAVLWRRAFVTPSNYLLKAFRSLDKLFHTLNQNRLTKGIVLVREHTSLPCFDPIRWRETTKRSLGTTRYLIRLLLILEIPVLFGMLISHDGTFDSSAAPPNVAAWILWVVATLVIAIHSTGLIGLERSRQTLDVLLTTPLTSESIVREKFAGVWRMIYVLWIPLGTAYLFQILWAKWLGFAEVNSNDLLFAVLRGLLAMAIYPALIAGVGFHFGMRCRSQAQAALVTLGLIAAVCVIPMIISHYLWSIGIGRVSVFEARWLSPAMVLSSSTSDGYEVYEPWAGMVLHFIMAAVLLWWLWARTLKTFAHRVNRNDGQIIDDDDIERLSLLRQKIVGSGIYQTKVEDE